MFMHAMRYCTHYACKLCVCVVYAFAHAKQVFNKTTSGHSGRRRCVGGALSHCGCVCVCVTLATTGQTPERRNSPKDEYDHHSFRIPRVIRACLRFETNDDRFSSSSSSLCWPLEIVACEIRACFCIRHRDGCDRFSAVV